MMLLILTDQLRTAGSCNAPHFCYPSALWVLTSCQFNLWNITRRPESVSAGGWTVRALVPSTLVKQEGSRMQHPCCQTHTAGGGMEQTLWLWKTSPGLRWGQLHGSTGNSSEGTAKSVLFPTAKSPNARDWAIGIHTSTTVPQDFREKWMLTWVPLDTPLHEVLMRERSRPPTRSFGMFTSIELDLHSTGTAREGLRINLPVSWGRAIPVRIGGKKGRIIDSIYGYEPTTAT